MKPGIRGVRSVEIDSSDSERATDFYTRVWNLREVCSAGGSTYLRGSSAYHHVLTIHPQGKRPAIRRLCFDAPNRAVVDQLFERVKASGMPVEQPATVKQPGGGYGFGFADHEGRNLAIICDVADHSDTADDPDRPRKITHVNLNTVDIRKTAAFLVDVLGFKLIDETPVLWFFHCDTSDHASIVVCPESKSTLNHVAFELVDAEAVMRGAGRMRDAGYPLEWGVGRHGAGNNVFGYFAGPDEFPIEYTAEVMHIDDSYVSHGPDYWRFPPGRTDRWGITPPHSVRWKRVQNLHSFVPGAYRIHG